MKKDIKEIIIGVIILVLANVILLPVSNLTKDISNIKSNSRVFKSGNGGDAIGNSTGPVQGGNGGDIIFNLNNFKN